MPDDHPEVEALANISKDELCDQLLKMADEELINQYYSALGLELNIGDDVQIISDHRRAKANQGDSGWSSHMARSCGCKGVIWEITDNGDIRVLG